MKLKRAFFLVVAIVFLVSFTKSISNYNQGTQLAQVSASTSSQFIEKFVLMNGNTNQDIAELTDGYIINTESLGTNRFKIRAETNPRTVGSVKFNLDQNSPVIKSVSPYVLGPVNLVNGEHTLAATPTTLARGRGILGQSKNIDFTVVGSTTTSSQTSTQSSPRTENQTNTQIPSNPTSSTITVTGIWLVNADTNQEIKQIQNNEVIDLSEIGTTNVTIKAETSVPLPGSVIFGLNDNPRYRIESLYPFTIPGGSSTDDFLPFTYEPGVEYNVTATPTSLSRGRGTQGPSYNVKFSFSENINTSTSSNRGSDVTTGGSGTRAFDAGIPAIACLNATVINNPTQYGAANPGAITVSWEPVAGYTKFKYWRLLNGNVLDTAVADGTSLFTTYLNPGTWTIRVSLYDGADWGPETEITGLVVSASGPATTNHTTCVSHGDTNSIAITSPSQNTNVLTGQNFTISAVGSPTNDQITQVKFYYFDGNGKTLLGSDSTAPYSITANIANRGFNCPKITAEATLENQLIIKSPVVYVKTTDSLATAPQSSCPGNGEVNDGFRITAPQQGQTFNSGQSFTVSATRDATAVTLNYVKFYHLGGNVAQNIASGLPAYNVTLIGTDNTSPYSTTYSITNPGNIGSSSATDIIRVVSFYSNGATNYEDVPVKINPPTSLPSITSAQIVNTSGTVLATMSSGMTVNIGNQSGGFGTNIAIKANASATPTPGSVKFTLQSSGTPYERIDNASPYSSHGDSGTTFTAWAGVQPGAYTLTITPYTLANATGTAGTSVSIPFVVVNNDDLTPPSSPAGVNVNYRSASEIRLSWNASATATAYKVYRTPGTTTTLGNVTSFVDTNGITSTGNYTYNITALDAAGNESGFSTSPTVPTLSTSFTAGANVQTISSVTPKVTPDGANAGTSQVAGSTGTIVGTSIYYSGVNYWNVNFSSGTDGWVSESSIELVPVAPAAPSNFTGSATSSSQINLTWTDNSNNETIFEIQRSTSSSFTSPTTTTHNWNSTSATVTGLTANTTYYFRIRAVGSTPSDVSAWVNSSPAGITTQSATAMANCVPRTFEWHDASRISVMAYSVVQSSPARIKLCWGSVSGLGYNTATIYRKGKEDTTWTQIGTVAGTTGEFTDTGAVGGLSAGTFYEYKIVIPTNVGHSAYGYVASGIELPAVENRGKILVLKDNVTMGYSIVASAFNILKEDLIADGWTVLEQTVDRYASASSVKQIITNTYNSNSDLKALYLFGRVPVPYSGGNVAPDGHDNHRGTWPADTYYSDLNGTWTDTGTFNNCCNSFYSNAPGDGKFDQINIPSVPELMVGRVDFKDMDSAAYLLGITTGQESIDLPQLYVGYINKARNYKRKNFVPQRRAFVFDNFIGMDFASNGFRNFAPLVGLQNMTNYGGSNPPTYRDQVNGQSYLWTYACGGGGYTQAANVGNTWDFHFKPVPPDGPINDEDVNLGGVFNLSFGSYFGDWNNSNNFLRAFISDPGTNGGLSNAWIGGYQGYFHHMGMGETIGYSFMKTIGNRVTQTYYPYGGGSGIAMDWTGYSYNVGLALMGDPTLRQDMIDPPSNLTVVNNGGTLRFNWTASDDTNQYIVYEVTTANGGLVRVTPTPVTGTQYQSTIPSSTTGKRYMVRAYKLMNGTTGTYYDLSLGSNVVQY